MKRGGCFGEKEMAMHTGASMGEHCRMQGAEREGGKRKGQVSGLGPARDGTLCPKQRFMFKPVFACSVHSVFKWGRVEGGRGRCVGPGKWWWANEDKCIGTTIETNKGKQKNI